MKNDCCYLALMDWFLTLNQLLLLILALLLVAFPAGATEFSQQLPGVSSRGSNSGTAGIGSVGMLFESFVADEKVARARVRDAAQRVLTARDPSWKNYYRAEYLGARTIHVGTYVVLMVRTLREKEKIEHALRDTRAQFEQLSGSPTVRGMRNLIVLVMDLSDRETGTGDTDEIGRRAIRDVNIAIFANLVRAPADVELAQRRLKRVEERYKGGLKVLRKELAYLEDRLDEVPER